MNSIFEAVYENGVLKPLESVKLSEHQRVTLRFNCHRWKIQTKN